MNSAPIPKMLRIKYLRLAWALSSHRQAAGASIAASKSRCVTFSSMNSAPQSSRPRLGIEALAIVANGGMDRSNHQVVGGGCLPALLRIGGSGGKGDHKSGDHFTPSPA